MDKEKKHIRDLLDVETQEINEQEIIEKYDKEMAFRKKTGMWKPVVTIIASVLSLFHLYTAAFGTLPSQQQRGFHIALGLGLIFLLYPGNRSLEKKFPWFYSIVTVTFLIVDFYLIQNKEINLIPGIVAALVIVILFFARWIQKTDGIPWFDVLLAALGIGVGMYQVVFMNEIISRVGMYNEMDYAVAATAVLLVLEAARRSVGAPIVVVAVIALLYAYLGPYFPDLFSHRGFSIQRIISHSFLSTEGILGIPIQISATFIYLFLLFGVMLRYTGIGQFFNDIAFAVTGRMVGGPAKAAVVASALQGMVTGSSVANTVGSGSFTIPLMKKAGYRSEFAAAVEAAASTGGQLMPPIMGAAAFLMIEFTNQKYLDIAAAATIPALLYFAGIFIAVHLESKKEKILGLPANQLPVLKDLILTQGYLFAPLIAIIAILVSGQSPMKAALIGIGVAFVVSLFRKETRMSLRQIIDFLEEGARVALAVIAATAAAGIIVGVVTLTGVGLKVAGGLLELANEQLILTMFFTMIASLILGMGLPTTANYVITATMAAPALLAFNELYGTEVVPILAAHLFVFYFGIVADITPPVALAAYAGSGIARSNPFMTGVTAMKIGIGAWIIPFIFVLNPVIILADVSWSDPVSILKVALAIITALIGMMGISASMIGYLAGNSKVWERVLSALGGLMLIYPGWLSDGTGIVILALVILSQRFRSKQLPSKSL